MPASITLKFQHSPPRHANLERMSATTMTPSAASPQPVRFFHQGRVVDVTGVHPTRSVLDWLREDARCTGTKEGCNEGDCGACTVVIGELAPAADAVDGRPATDVVGGLRLQTVNACIQFLPTLHGKALFTVEDLKTLAGRTDGPARGDSPHEKHPVRRLHPVQQAMVECHGSQCGFCTPGFVMSLWSTYERHCDAGTRPTRQELADDLSGNLCRCTGYRPILDAGQRMFDLPAAPFDTGAAVAALTRLKAEAEEAATTDDGAAAGLRYAAARHGRTDTFHAPTTLDALAAFGGFEIATLVGVVLQAARERRVIVVDGFIASAAVLVAQALRPHVVQRCIAAHRSAEPGHGLLLAHLGLEPLLQLDLRLGEGSGAALAWPLLESACLILREMASFEAAGVSRKDAA